jgi:hypothetical protein
VASGHPRLRQGDEGGEIRLTRYGSASAGLCHYIPVGWVQAAGLAAHLNKPCDEAQREWRVAPPGEGG